VDGGHESDSLSVFTRVAGGRWRGFLRRGFAQASVRWEQSRLRVVVGHVGGDWDVVFRFRFHPSNDRNWRTSGGGSVSARASRRVGWIVSAL